MLFDLPPQPPSSSATERLFRCRGGGSGSRPFPGFTFRARPETPSYSSRFRFGEWRREAGGGGGWRDPGPGSCAAPGPATWAALGGSEDGGGDGAVSSAPPPGTTSPPRSCPPATWPAAVRLLEPFLQAFPSSAAGRRSPCHHGSPRLSAQLSWWGNRPVGISELFPPEQGHLTGRLFSPGRAAFLFLFFLFFTPASSPAFLET